MWRVGLGIDSHRFIKQGKPLMLAGVRISDKIKVRARSDGDVVLHALCNALSQAMAGSSFSKEADVLWCQGVNDSREYLKVFEQKLKQGGYEIGNVGVSIEAGKPRLEEFNFAMKQSITQLLKLKPDQVGITITSGENLTEFGKGKGIQAIVIVLIKKVEK